MITLEKILEMWAEDSVIDEINLDDSSIETTKLHAKYLELLSTVKLLMKRNEFALAKMKKDKWLYFGGKMTREQMDSRGWAYDPFDGGSKPLKSDMDYYYAADPDLQKLVAKIEYQETMISTLEEIMNTLRWRHSTIKNIIDWRRFQSGG